MFNSVVSIANKTASLKTLTSAKKNIESFGGEGFDKNLGKWLIIWDLTTLKLLLTNELLENLLFLHIYMPTVFLYFWLSKVECQYRIDNKEWGRAGAMSQAKGIVIKLFFKKNGKLKKACKTYVYVSAQFLFNCYFFLEKLDVFRSINVFPVLGNSNLFLSLC